ncbi:hypothetical protein ARMGADRAFT_776162 [Armillaria gallica]|uniref:Mid2 domain-containing protein n=1 Tax=Armillaria gallica TaxID=47427 RepID=A0A2H3CZK5_ARMGA|nr:hypothetical protein ARMGADRAFT_776162 [Armillaria gallica]
MAPFPPSLDYSCYTASSFCLLEQLLKMLILILLCCIKFVVSNGFHFDEFTGTVPSVGIPITLSWHFDIGDPDDVFFQRRDIGEQYFFQGDDIRAEITHPNGTLQVAFPSIGRFIVDAIASGTDPLNLLNSSEIFLLSLASENSGSSTTTSVSSSSASPSGEIGQTPSLPAPPPSMGSAHRNRDRKASIIIGSVLGSVFSLLFLLGGVTFLFIRQQKYLRVKHSPTPNVKITSERQSSLSSISSHGGGRLRTYISPIGTVVDKRSRHTGADQRTRPRGIGGRYDGEEKRPLCGIHSITCGYPGAAGGRKCRTTGESSGYSWGRHSCSYG